MMKLKSRTRKIFLIRKTCGAPKSLFQSPDLLRGLILLGEAGSILGVLRRFNNHIEGKAQEINFARVDVTPTVHSG